MLANCQNIRQATSLQPQIVKSSQIQQQNWFISVFSQAIFTGYFHLQAFIKTQPGVNFVHFYHIIMQLKISLVESL